METYFSKLIFLFLHRVKTISAFVFPVFFSAQQLHMGLCVTNVGACALPTPGNYGNYVIS